MLRGEEVLSPENLCNKQLIVIDEIGPLELSDKGWSSSIEKLVSTSKIPHLWVVRKSILKKVIRKWNIGNVYIFDIEDSNLQEAQMKINEIFSFL